MEVPGWYSVQVTAECELQHLGPSAVCEGGIHSRVVGVLRATVEFSDHAIDQREELVTNLWGCGQARRGTGAGQCCPFTGLKVVYTTF